MNQLVIYQKNELEWEDLEELEEIKEAEILEERSRSLALEETQIVVIQSLESPLCKEIISIKEGFESKEVEG